MHWLESARRQSSWIASKRAVDDAGSLQKLAAQPTPLPPNPWTRHLPARHSSMDRSRATTSCFTRPLPNSRIERTTRQGRSRGNPSASVSEPPASLPACGVPACGVPPAGVLPPAGVPTAGVPLACRLAAVLPGPRGCCEASSSVPSVRQRGGRDTVLSRHAALAPCIPREKADHPATPQPTAHLTGPAAHCCSRFPSKAVACRSPHHAH